MSTTAEGLRSKKLEAELGKIPRWYNPWLHLASTTGLGVIVLVLGVWNLGDIRPLEWLTVPIVFLFSNAFEWRVHKYVLHRRFWPFGYIYEQHTPMHHGIYTTDSMAMRSTKEFGLVLIPALGILGIIIAAAPPAVLLGYFVSPNVGWLFLVTASLYMVMYELTHLSYHLPEDSFIGRRKIIKKLGRLHATHHDPALMQHWNFNVTVPLFDWILGTYRTSRSE